MATSVFKEYFKGYEILGELGRGNARVLKARSIADGSLVAIKHFAFNTDAGTLRRFQRESAIMKSIRHDFIVKIIDVQLDAELPYIVMELIDGGDLRSLLKTCGTLDIATVISLAQHMTEALETIHEKAIVHRDIKPENIMVRKNANGELQFLLTDFGVARLREEADAVTVTGASMLTYDYASPEQFNQSKTVAVQTDYYSLGVVLYECLTGAVPFEYQQDDLLLHIHRVISAPVPIPLLPGGHPIPSNLLQLLDGLLRKQPSQRLSDPVSFMHLLMMEPSLIQQTAVKNQSPVKPKLIAAICLLLVVIMAVVYARSNNDDNNTNNNNNLVGTTSKEIPVSIETKQVLPPEGAHIIHARHTPALRIENLSSPMTSPGIDLTNGMYYSDFDQQDSAWETGKDANSEFILLDGKYTMKGFKDSLTYSSAIKLNMDVERNFSVAASAVHDGEGSADPFGIIFCGDEATDAYYVFYITSNGYYSVGVSVKDQWTVLQDWTPSANLRQDGALNVFSIERRGGALRILINDKLEKILPFEGPYGSSFGLRIDGTQTVSFDQFIVKGSHG